MEHRDNIYVFGKASGNKERGLGYPHFWYENLAWRGIITQE